MSYDVMHIVWIASFLNEIMWCAEKSTHHFEKRAENMKQTGFDHFNIKYASNRHLNPSNGKFRTQTREWEWEREKNERLGNKSHLSKTQPSND